MHGHATMLQCHISFGFHGILLVFSCSCLLCFESLGDWLGARES